MFEFDNPPKGKLSFVSKKIVSNRCFAVLCCFAFIFQIRWSMFVFVFKIKSVSEFDVISMFCYVQSLDKSTIDLCFLIGLIGFGHFHYLE